MESFWDECLALPSKLKDWDAYHDLKGAIQKYLDVFPLLHRLAAKVVIDTVQYIITMGCMKNYTEMKHTCLLVVLVFKGVAASFSLIVCRL